MNEAIFQVLLRLATIGMVLAAIPESARDWAVWLLAGLIIFVEFGIEPLVRYVLRRLPCYRTEDPEVAARSIKQLGHFAEASLAAVILIRVLT